MFQNSVDHASTPILSWCVYIYMYIHVHIFSGISAAVGWITLLRQSCLGVYIYIYVYLCLYIQRHQRHSRVDDASTPILSGCVYMYIYTYVYVHVFRSIGAADE